MPTTTSEDTVRAGRGPRVLDDAARARLLGRVHTARTGAPVSRLRLLVDDRRRLNSTAASRHSDDNSAGDGFDRATLPETNSGHAGPGGGRSGPVGRPVEYRGTTAQIVGLWPWAVGAGAPLIGTPLGPHLRTGAPVCFDPMNWFSRGGFITAPSLFVLGLNGFGKSSLVRRIVLGGIAQGITPLVLADVKPDYRGLVEAVGGQVIELSYGNGTINPLDAGVAADVLAHLEQAGLRDAATAMEQELHARQITLLCALIELVRGHRIEDFETTVLGTALRILHTPVEHGGRGFTPHTPPIIDNLVEVILTGGEELRLDAATTSHEDYLAAIVRLRRSLRALTQGPFGAVFNGSTTAPIDLDAVAVCVDVSRIPKGDTKLKGAVMLTCWAAGFSAIESLNALTDAHLAPQRYFQVVMDELWQVLGLGEWMVDRVDELTRLQRGMAAGLIMISHTVKDLDGLGASAAKALGFLERSRAKIFGALPAEEIARLDKRVPFTDTEAALVTGWSSPTALTGEPPKAGQPRQVAPGTGKFLLKIGEKRQPGIPFQVALTDTERRALSDTSARFDHFSGVAAASPAGATS